jgi:hypothetical protein
VPQIRGLLTLACIALTASPVAGQERGIVFRVLGGGYSHTMNLNSSGPLAHFKQGLALETGLGVQLNKYFAILGDLTFAQTKGLGEVAFVGDGVNRYYYGGQLQLRYPLSRDFVPYIFGGGGRVHVDQQGVETEENFQHFTRYAGMFGAGLNIAIPKTQVAVLAEGKGLAYKWVAAPFKRNQLDLTYSVGIAYRFGF